MISSPTICYSSRGFVWPKSHKNIFISKDPANVFQKFAEEDQKSFYNLSGSYDVLYINFPRLTLGVLMIVHEDFFLVQ